MTLRLRLIEEVQEVLVLEQSVGLANDVACFGAFFLAEWQGLVRAARVKLLLNLLVILVHISLRCSCLLVLTIRVDAAVLRGAVTCVRR